MERLAFTLPPFCRIAWASPDAKEAWAPILARAVCVARSIAIESVLEGQRRAAVLTHATWAADARRIASAGFTSQPVRGGVLVARTRDAIAAIGAIESGDVDLLGSLFGVPPCCARISRTLRDPVADVVERTGTAQFLVRAPANILLWRLSTTATFHTPCSFDCDAASHRATQVMALAKDHALERLLGLATEWSSLHGIAEVKLPILRFTYDTDAFAKKVEVRALGEVPANTPRGLRFPFRDPKKRLTIVERDVG